MENGALRQMGETALEYPKMMGRLWEYIIDSKKRPLDEKTAFLASNAITALNLAGVSFSGLDLSGVHIPGADLSHGIFYNTNFTGANLAEVDFQQACLGKAQLTNANLESTDFGVVVLGCQLSEDEHLREEIAVYKNRIAASSFESLYGDEINEEIYVWSDDGQPISAFAVESPIRSLAFANNGNVLIAATDSGIKIWDIEKGTFLQESLLYVSKAKFRDSKLSVSPSKKKPLLAANIGGTLHVWDLKSSSLLLVKEMCTETPYFVDEDQLLICVEGKVTLINLSKKQIEQKWSMNSVTSFHSLHFSFKGKFIAAFHGSSLAIWHFDQPLNIPDDLAKTIREAMDCKIAFSSNGQKFALSLDTTLQIWNTTGVWTLAHCLSKKPFTQNLKFIKDDQAVLLTYDREMTILKLPKTSQVSKENLHLSQIRSLMVSEDQKILASLSSEKLIKWSLSNRGNCIIVEYAERIQGVFGCALSKDSRYLLLQFDNKAVLQNTHTREQKELVNVKGKIQGIGFFSGSRAAIICENAVMIYDMESCQSVFILQEGQVDRLLCHHFSSDGHWLVFLTIEHAIWAWDSISQTSYGPRLLTERVGWKIASIKCSENYVICTQYEYGIYIWDPLKNIEFALKEFTGAWVIDRQQDHFLLKSQNGFGLYKIYDQVPTLIHNITDSCTHCWQVCTSPSYRPLLAVSLRDGTIQLWDINKACLIDTLSGHSFCVTQITFSLSKEYLMLFASDTNGSISCWELTKEIKLLWISEPHSLILKEVNTDQALFNQKIESMRAERLPSNTYKSVTPSEIIDRLWQDILNSKNAPLDAEIASSIARNAITTLNLAGVSFSGVNLSGIQIPNADLSHGIFYNTDFTGANLTGVNFQYACLGKALFTNATLTNADFGSSLLKCSLSQNEFFYEEIIIHKNRIAACSFNTKNGNEKIHIWEDGQLFCTFTLESPLVSLVFSSDCKALIASTENGVKIFDAESGILLQELSLPIPKEEQRQSKVSISSSLEKPLLAVNIHGNLLVFDLKNSSLLHSIDLRIPSCEKSNSETPYFVDEDNLLTCIGGKVSLINLSTKQVVKTWMDSNEYFHSLHFSPTTKLLAAFYGPQNSLALWHLDQPVKISNNLFEKICMNKEGKSLKIAFSSKGDKLALSFDTTIQIWDTFKWILLHCLYEKTHLENLKFVQNDQALLLVLEQALRMQKLPNPLTQHQPTGLHLNPIQSLIISEDQKMLISLSRDALIKWSLTTRPSFSKIGQWKAEGILNCALSSDSNYLLLQFDHRVILWDLAKQKELVTFNQTTRGIGFLSNHRAVIIYKNFLRIYDLRKRRFVSTLQEQQNNSLEGYHFSSNEGGWFSFVSHQANKNKIFQALHSLSGICYEVKRPLESCYEKFEKVKFSKNYMIVRYSTNFFDTPKQYIYIWNPLIDNEARVLEDVNDAWLIDEQQGHFLLKSTENILRLCQILSNKTEPRTLHYFNDSTIDNPHSWEVSTSTSPILAIGLESGIIQLWNVKEGLLIEQLLGHSHPVIKMIFSFSKKCSMLFSADTAGSICCWDITKEAKLLWRSEPHSLVVTGVNVHQAILDATTESVLLSKKEERR